MPTETCMPHNMTKHIHGCTNNSICVKYLACALPTLQVLYNVTNKLPYSQYMADVVHSDLVF